MWALLCSLPQRNWEINRICPIRCVTLEELPTRCQWYFTEIRFKQPFLVGSWKGMNYNWASSLCLYPPWPHSCTRACDASHSTGHPVLTQGTEPSWACGVLVNSSHKLKAGKLDGVMCWAFGEPVDRFRNAFGMSTMHTRLDKCLSLCESISTLLYSLGLLRILFFLSFKGNS